MSNQFEFKLGSQVFKTGCLVPEVKPLSFSEYPATELLTIEECREILLNPKRVRARNRFDWILNQGRLSSCNAYAAVAGVMKARAFTGQPHVDLAPEFVYQYINGGRDGGSMLDDGMLAITERGCCRRELYPYEKYRDRPTSEAVSDGQNYRAHEAFALPTNSLELLWQSMVSAACREQPVVLAVHVGNAFMNSGVWAGINRGPGNHAVHVDDVVMTTKNPTSWFDFALDHAGSWGEGWGDKGRSYLGPQHVEETMRYHQTYAIRGAVQAAA